MTMWASGYRVKKIKPLEPDKAMKVGAEFVGEGFILAVSMAVVVFEYNRSAQKTAQKNEEKRERIKETQRTLQAKLNTLDIRLKAIEDLLKQQKEMEEHQNLLTRVVPVVGTEKPKYIEPPKEKLVKIDDDDDDEEEDSTTGSVEKEQQASASSTVESPQSKPKSSWWKFW